MERRKKTNGVDISTMSFGKIPPQSIMAEDAVLGVCMLNSNAIDLAFDTINSECFYKETNKVIFNSFENLKNKKSEIDMVTVMQELIIMGKLAEIGGAYVLTELTKKVIGNEPIETYCKIIKLNFVKREIIKISGELLCSAYDDTKDAIDLVDEFGKESFILSNIFYSNKFDSASKIAEQHFERVKMLQSRIDKNAITGVDTGFKVMNNITFGWQPSDLIILAARPSVGKTAFSLNLAKSACKSGTGVGFFSLEMSTQSLTSRILSDISNVSLEKIIRGLMNSYEFSQYEIAKNEFSNYKICIDDTAAITPQELRSKARQMVKKHGVGMIIIDYLQLMRGNANSKAYNREQEISEISRNLKALAKELNIPIIALSQLSRAVETRDKSKIPQLSDLRESGAIEQDADMVMFIYRPEYNGEKVNEHGESTKGQTFVKIAKHRNGALDTLEFKADLSTQTFYEVIDPLQNFPIYESSSNWYDTEPNIF